MVYHFSSRVTITLNLCLIYFKTTWELAILLEHMHKKFEINRTKIKGDCQSGRKVVHHDSKIVRIYTISWKLKHLQDLWTFLFDGCQVAPCTGGAYLQKSTSSRRALSTFSLACLCLWWLTRWELAPIFLHIFSCLKNYGLLIALFEIFV